VRKEVAFWSCVTLLVLGSLAFAGQPHPFLGMSLDMAPLPDLLTKHLRLDPGQGIRINNVVIGSPADRAGLERDDIVVAFQGQKVGSSQQLTGAIRKAGIEAAVALEVIHLGQRQTVQTKLEPAPEPTAVKWKYPAEPDVVTSWRPGRIFKIGPDGQRSEIPINKIPDVGIDLKKYFKESYTYHHTTGGDNYSITIEGDPADKNSQVRVQDGSTEYSATAGALEALPEKYREPARQAVDDARTSLKTDIRIELPDAVSPEAGRQFFESIPQLDLGRLSEQKDQVLQKLQGQMEQLQQRIKEMEDRNRELVDKLLQKYDTNKSKTSESQTPAPSEPKQKPAL
jgi:hypothetical protein